MLFHVLLALVVVLAAMRLVGGLFRWLRQPAVVGEMVAGLLLGPSLLGRVAPELSAYLLPPGLTPVLAAIAQVGVILYMFVVGLHLDTSVVRARRSLSLVVSTASIAVPFVAGVLVSGWLHPRFGEPGVPFLPFALFIGVAMSVTAFPVLARILDDRRLSRTPLGSLALACAAVNDVAAWCLLAAVVGVVKSAPGEVAWTLGLTAAYLAGVAFVIRPLVRVLSRWHDEGRLGAREAFAAMCGLALLSALTTEAIGIHAIFGAFLVGAVVPHDSELARAIAARLEDLVGVLLLPVFFAVTGLRTELGLLSGPGPWLALGLVLAAASVGKFGGTAVAARASGMAWREAAMLGTLMNTRGLMELIVLGVGLELGVLGPLLFSIMVMMAIGTTVMTGPVLDALAPAGSVEPDRR